MNIFCQYAYAYKRNILEKRGKVLFGPTRSSHFKFSTQRVLSKKYEGISSHNKVMTAKHNVMSYIIEKHCDGNLYK